VERGKAPGPRGADLRIDERGEVLPLTDAARSAISLRHGLWRFAPSHDGVLLLERVSSDVDGDRVALAGSIVDAGLLDVLSFLHGAKRSGSLTVVSGDVCKAVLFENGNVVSAMSNREEDRLGEMLYRYGKLSPDEIRSALQEVGGTRRLGKVLVDRGLLNSHDLWNFIRKQVEEIVFSLLVLTEGTFYFSVPGQPDHFPAHVPMSSQALLMEGVRRADELRYFRQLIPSSRQVVEALWPRPEGLRLDPHDEAVLAAVTAPVTVADLARASRVGEFEATKAVFHLLRAGALRKVEDEGTPASAEARLDALISTFNEIFREIYAAIERRGGAEQFRQGLAAFLSAHGYPELFDGVALDPTGELSRSALLANLAKAKTDTKADYLYAGLNELLFFEIFEAREMLGNDEEQELMRRVNALFQRLR
jgi:hypothetical protein